MSRRDKRDTKIRNNPSDVDFREIVSWLTAHGFSLDRTEGSHHIFTHPTGKLLNLQPDRNGKAKPYQVKQAIRILDGLKERGA
jgi:predicted RNA binding protein YcfA (HicA-like mRNA interferase family)